MAGAEGSEEAETRLFGVIAGQHSRSSMAITSGNLFARVQPPFHGRDRLRSGTGSVWFRVQPPQL